QHLLFPVPGQMGEEPPAARHWHQALTGHASLRRLSAEESVHERVTSPPGDQARLVFGHIPLGPGLIALGSEVIVQGHRVFFPEEGQAVKAIAVEDGTPTIGWIAAPEESVAIDHAFGAVAVPMAVPVNDVAGRKCPDEVIAPVGRAENTPRHGTILL